MHDKATRAFGPLQHHDVVGGFDEFTRGDAHAGRQQPANVQGPPEPGEQQAGADNHGTEGVQIAQRPFGPGPLHA